MAKLNLQLQLDKEKEADILELIESYLFSYNLLSHVSTTLTPIASEICDNSDGTVDFRILDFAFDPESLMEESNKATEDFLNNLGMSKEDIFRFMGDIKYED